MMFSATLNDETRGVCKRFMVDPLEVIVEDDAKLTLRGLQQRYVKVTEREKVDVRHVVAAEVGAEHDLVLVVAVEARRLGPRGQQLDVAAAAEGILVVLNLCR